MLAKIARIFHTVRHLKTSQLLFFVLRRKFPAKAVAFQGSPVVRKAGVLFDPITVTGTGQDFHFKFINIAHNIKPGLVNWAPQETPRLWRYNLHYFDYLRDPCRTDDNKKQLIESWIDNNPQGSQPGWEPFTASLRIVNWFFYFSKHPDAVTDKALHSLYVQTLWLEKNDEKHILANHYFENLKALLFAGVFFEGDDAKRWLSRASCELEKQLKEQTLADGGHYERTPQYHSLMLENYLDIYNVAVSNPSLFSASFLELFQHHALRGLEFYRDILFPDGKPPLFNDTAFDVSPSLGSLEGYYQRLIESPPLDNADALINKPDSGLYGWRAERDMLIIDAGDIGPSYQPGHTHCDMLSYELMLDGERVVVDTGVCEYEPGDMRQYLRSTRAHNTVSVAGQEQSEVWGEFRVARRAAIIQSELHVPDSVGGNIEFKGACQGFYQLGECVCHQRQFVVSRLDNGSIKALTIQDQINAKQKYPFESYIHLHPAINYEDRGDGYICLSCDGREIAELIVAKNSPYSFKDGVYCPAFNVKIPNVCIIISIDACQNQCLSYTISKL